MNLESLIRADNKITLEPDIAGGGTDHDMISSRQEYSMNAITLRGVISLQIPQPLLPSF
jgi:hypothetical protein